MVLVLECVIICFILLVPCVVSIVNGSVSRHALKPYIPGKTLIKKWAIIIIGNPLIAAALSGIMLLFFYCCK